MAFVVLCVYVCINRGKSSLKVREHKSLGPYVENLSKLAVRSFKVSERLVASLLAREEMFVSFLFNDFIFVHKFKPTTFCLFVEPLRVNYIVMCLCVYMLVTLVTVFVCL